VVLLVRNVRMYHLIDGSYNINWTAYGLILMRKTSFHILRVGVAITFLWIGVLIFKSPEGWGSILQPWAAGLLPVPLKTAMIGTAILDLAIGLFLLIDFWVWLAAAVGSLHLIVVLTVTGITGITVRDIGLLTATLALMIDAIPLWLSTKITFWKRADTVQSS
jgi:uncharacterized membrane protein